MSVLVKKEVLPSEAFRAQGFRSELAEKIFLDRYSKKATNKDLLKPGDTVVFTVFDENDRRRREVGLVNTINLEISRDVVIDYKYKLGSETISIDHIDVPEELSYDDMCDRLSKAVSSIELMYDPNDHVGAAQVADDFNDILKSHEFVPGGRIMAGAGAPGDLSFYNCFVIPSPKDTRAGILNTAQEQFEIMSRGGGVGINVSSLRPAYSYVKGVNGRSSGAVSWADLYSIITNKVEQGGSRRGALMLILDVWHPDIETFIKSKREIGFLDYANISVGIPDAFMKAVENDESWPLIFPSNKYDDYDEVWDGDIKKWQDAGREVVVYREVSAKELWQSINQSAWASAEPGLFFSDRINEMSNSNYYNTMKTCNPCGEQPLPDYGVCNLGAINLSQFVKDKEFWDAPGEEFNSPGHFQSVYYDAFIAERLDIERLIDVASKATHFLDNIIDLTPYFIKENATQQCDERRVGLGIMGLAEMLVRMGVKYGSPLGNKVVDTIFQSIRDAAYNRSIELAEQKGAFPLFEAEGYLNSGYAKTLPAEIREGIKKHGVRNVTILTVAPTGSSGSMQSTSTGIEPYFMFEFDQIGRLGRNRVQEPIVEDFYAYNTQATKLPDHFVVTEDLAPEEHVAVMAVAQKYVDSAISKTCNLPEDYTVDDVAKVYELMYSSGCKGGTVYRDKCREEQCLVKVEESPAEEAPALEVKPVKPAAEVKELFGRPRFGLTHYADTHLGRVHVTLNLDSNNFDLFDVFVRLSKSGSDVDADTDAIGRLISLVLRLNSEIPTRRRLELVIEQLTGIASNQSYGFGKNKVRSVPDGIARCLGSMLEKISVMENFLSFINVKNPGDDQAPPAPAASEPVSSGSKKGRFLQTCPQCSCVTAVRADGCFKCLSCDFSVC